MSTLYSHPVAFAGSTFAVPHFWAVFIYICVGLAKRMTIFTYVYFVLGSMFLGSNCLKMSRINAKCVFANMVNIVSRWNLSFFKFVGITVRLSCLRLPQSSRGTKMTIFTNNIPCPKPASISFVNKTKKSLFSRWRGYKWIAMTIPSHVVFSTPSTPNTKFITPVYGTYISHLHIVHQYNPTVKQVAT